MKKVFLVEGERKKKNIEKVSVKLTIAIWCVICFNSHFVVVFFFHFTEIGWGFFLYHLPSFVYKGDIF